jgi:hypothetical protein
MGHLGQDKHTAFDARRNGAVELRDVRGGGIEVVLVFCELPPDISIKRSKTVSSAQTFLSAMRDTPLRPPVATMHSG